ncbi:MAG: hypothetical protein LBK57_01430 [Clostridiales Family XIII bacterium]|jgi:hypothetical protein|nr:hypothetical protein [Clostridiales Family XIII bacterium]
MYEAAMGFGEFEITFPMDAILELKLSRKTGEHSRLAVKGVATQEAIRKATDKLDGKQTISLLAKGEKGNRPLFTGVVTSLTSFSEGDVHKVEVIASGCTATLDTSRRRRSFQNAKMTHEELAKAVLKPYPKADSILHGEDKGIGDMFLQYDETDWEFLKRVASDLHVPLIPADTHALARFHIGLPKEKNPSDIGGNRITIRKDIRSLMRQRKNDLTELGENGVVSVGFESGVWFDTGDSVRLNGRVFFVYEAESRLIEGLLLHSYTLRDETGFLTPKETNEDISGVSLFGTVTDVQKDKVSLALDIDEGNEDCGSRLFPYSTVYSSPDGSGFYFMPEKGDRILLHFPEASESGAYARSAVDTVPSDPSRRSEPNNKVLYTKYGKEIKLTPNSVEITSGMGHKICLYDNGGVTIDSAKSVSVNAGGDILIESGTKINVSGNEIGFSQGTGNFNMSGGVITEDGQEVKIGE